MNATTRITAPYIVALLASALVAGCSTAPSRPEGVSAVRDKLTRLQSEPTLAERVPLAIRDAELAVRAAETPQADAALARHLVFVADHKVDIAWAQSKTRQLALEREEIAAQRESTRLDSRTREADRAHADAELARDRADAARAQTAVAQRQAEDLRQQLRALDATPTDRGLVMVLGDVHFSTGRAELRDGVGGNLDKLAAFLTRYPERTATIEGHADSSGNADANVVLSQRRADSVRSYLAARGIAAGRLIAIGMGDSQPVASNATAAGRQRNRRVEIIISDPGTEVTALRR